MRLSGEKYLGTKTGHRLRNTPYDKERFEDWTEAQVCDVRWEVEMSMPDAYNVYPEAIDIL